MTQEQFNEMKESYISYMKDFMKEFGQFGPMITVFADNPQEEERPAIIHIPIPPQFMKNNETKDEFVNEMVPEMFADIKERFKPYAVAWAAEAWIRRLSKNDHFEGDYEQLPKKEVIFVSFQQKDNNTGIVYNIKRNGKQVTATGDIVDQVELEEDKEFVDLEGMEGRFSNLFSKFDD
jgi:uncharacterized protein YutD